MRPGGETSARLRRANPASSRAGSALPGSQASTRCDRSARITGRPARIAAWRTTSSKDAPDTDSSVNTSCSRSEARSSSSWASMIRACTASVISTNGTSRSKAISVSPLSAAARTRTPGSAPTYRRPSSTASALTPVPPAAARSAA